MEELKPFEPSSALTLNPSSTSGHALHRNSEPRAAECSEDRKWKSGISRC